MDTCLQRIDRDVLTIKRTLDGNSDKFKTLGVFYQEKSEVLRHILSLPAEEVAKIAADCRENGVRWRMYAKYLRRAEEALLGETEILDLSQTEERIPPVQGVSPEECIRVHTGGALVQVSFALTGTFRMLLKSNRNGKTEIDSMGVTPETRFTVVNETLPFWDDRYSLALTAPDLWIALSVEDPKIGKKGSACVRLYVRQNGVLYLDDLAKYTDVTELLRWVHP